MDYLYTFVIDYEDQIYFSQIRDSTIENAIKNWIRSLDLKTLGVKATTNESLLSEVEYIEERPIAIAGVKNVWCIGFKLDEEMALTHIIKTCD